MPQVFEMPVKFGDGRRKKCSWYIVYPFHDESDWWDFLFIISKYLFKFFWPPVSSFYQNFHPFCRFKTMEDSSGVAAAFIHSTFVISSVPCSTCRTSTVGTTRQSLAPHHSSFVRFLWCTSKARTCFDRGLQASVLFKRLVLCKKLFCLSANTTRCRGGRPVPQPGVQ